MAEARVERRLAAVLAADVAGYSRLMGADEEGTLAALRAHQRELLDPKIAEFRGRIVKTTGDGLLIEFGSVVDATHCAMDVQRGMTERNVSVPPDKRLEFRIGINVGDVIVEDNDIFGDGVNVAARLEGIAEPGGIVISASAHDAVINRIMIELEPALTQAEIRVIRRQRPENVDAWGYYHQASGALGGGGWNELAVSEALNFLQRALELDANFALARAQLALLSALAQNTGLVEHSTEHAQEALEAAEMAIAADAGSSEVLGYAGCALSDLGHTKRGAEILRQAVEIDPSNAQAEVALGAALAMLGDLDAGIARMPAMGLGSVPATGGWDFGAGRLGCFCCVPTERGKHWKRRLWLHDVIRGFIYRRSLKPWRRRHWDGPNSPGQRSWLRGASDRTLRGKRSNALTDAAPLEPCQTFGTPIRQLASTKCSPEVAYWPISVCTEQSCRYRSNNGH